MSLIVPSSSCILRWLLGFLLVPLLMTPGVQAQLPLARIRSVFPPGASSGTSLQVRVRGHDLDEPIGLVFSDPRIRGLPDPKDSSLFQVTVPPECPPGWVDVRFSGRFGVSNPRRFAVGQFQEIAPALTNTTPEAALAVSLDTVVNGHAESESVHWFRLALPADQRVVVTVESREIDSRLEPVLEVLDDAGNELDRASRGFLDLPAGPRREVLLAIHDRTFRGGEEFPYRLLASTTPHIDFALPASLRPGQRQSVVLYGRNLPGSRPAAIRGVDGRPLESISVEVNAPPKADPIAHPGSRLSGAGLRGFQWRLTGSHGRSNPVFFLLTDSNAAVPTWLAVPDLGVLAPPGEFSSFFASEGSVAGVRFQGRKGEVWWVDLFADRLGRPSDPSLVLQRVFSKTNAEPIFRDLLELKDAFNDFAGPGYPTATTDPAGAIELPDDGEFRLVTRDLFHPLRSQARLPFHLSVRRPHPDFQLIVHPVVIRPADPNQRVLHPWSTFLRRGQTLPVQVLAYRLEGFAGEIELRTLDLPPGLRASEARIPAGAPTALIFLRADSDAPFAASHLRVVGRARVGETLIDREAVPANQVWEVADYQQEVSAVRPTDQLAISISGAEAVPVAVDPVSSTPIELAADGRAPLALRITRQPGFEAELKLKAAGHPEFDKLPEFVVPAQASEASFDLNLAGRKLAPGRYSLHLTGPVKGSYRNNPEAVARAESDLKSATELLAAATDSTRADAEQQKRQAEERLKAATERAKPREVTFPVFSAPWIIVVRPPETPPPA